MVKSTDSSGSRQPLKEIELAWLAEAERRLAAYKSGSIEAIAAEQLFSEIRARIAQRGLDER